MNRENVVDLLTMLQAYDSRTVGETDIKAWLHIATLEGWKSAHAFRAVSEYHRSRGDKARMTPAHISDLITAARKAISKRLFTRDIEPPAELGGDVAAELKWRRETIPALIGHHLDNWARDGQLPTPTNEIPKTSVEGQRRIAELVGGAFSIGKAIA